MAANDIPNGTLAGLTKVADLFVQKMKQKISQNKLPREISEAISVGTAQQAGDILFIDVDIDLRKAPMAAAFEWGSGVYKQRGTPERYRIEPREKQALAFDFREATNIGNIRLTKEGKAILPYVMHPGVAPRPYIIPALVENKEEFRKILKRELKAAIMRGVPPMTIIEVKL